MNSLLERLFMLIGQYGVQCSETKELAPTTELADTLGEVAELERQLAGAQKNEECFKEFFFAFDEHFRLPNPHPSAEKRYLSALQSCEAAIAEAGGEDGR